MRLRLLRWELILFSSPFLISETIGGENSCCWNKLLTVHVGRCVKSSTCLVPFVIYSSIGAVSAQGYFSAMGLTVYKNQTAPEMEVWRAPLTPTSARFSALILSLQCTHPIQLGSVMGLLCRVKICTHFSPWKWPSEQLPLGIRAHLPTFLCLFLLQYMSPCIFPGLVVFHGVMILLLISSWLRRSFGKIWREEAQPHLIKFGRGF